MSTSTTDPMIGRLIDGRYRVRSRLARGGMATVYVATDLRLERRVALKVMHPHLADDAQFRERFIQEARSAARLAHPNVVSVFDQGQDGESAYLVMEYLRGITLRDLLQEYDTLTPEQTMDIVEAVLSGLAAAHKAGIVHRDLKPENVLLADDGRIKIGDFGLARAVTANTASGAALLGTIAYLSPELVTRGVADARSDIYALGIMMYEMLAGEQPYRGEQPMQIAYQHANETMPAPSSKNPRVPEELDELVAWATARDPEQRPRDARVMLERLYEVQNSTRGAVTFPSQPQPTRVLTPLAAPPATQGPTGETQVLAGAPTADVGEPLPDSAAALAATEPRRRRRGRWLLLVVAALLAIAGATGWYFGSGPGALVTIPGDLASTTVEDARQRLTDLGFKVLADTGEIDSPTIPAGLVVDTAPGMGEELVKGSTVELLVSTGPRPIAMADFWSMSAEEAEAAIAAAPWVAEEPMRQFSGEVPEGRVIDALGADGTSLRDDPVYGEGQPVTLVISSGAVPPVADLTIEEAIAALSARELTAVVGGQEYSESIGAGRVIRLEHGEVLRPGDPVTLITSLGPAPVAVPDVAGLTRDEAVARLEADGFSVSYNPLFAAFPGATVTSTEPGAGQVIARGSTVTIYLQIFG